MDHYGGNRQGGRPYDNQPQPYGGQPQQGGYYQQQAPGGQAYGQPHGYAQPGYGQPQQGYAPGFFGGMAEGEQHYDGSLSDPAVVAFTKRVYGYFTAALVTATAACFGGMELTSYLIAAGQQSTLQGLSIGAVVAFFASFLFVAFSRKAHSPLKVGLLFLFAASAGFMTTPLITAYLQAGLGMTVLFGFGITSTIFFGLTVYTLVSGKDFRNIGGFLLVGLLLLIGIGLMSFFVPISGPMQLVWTFVGVAVFTGYILFDTSMVTRNYFYSGDAIGAAMMLFYDFIMLFKFILRLLASRD